MYEDLIKRLRYAVTYDPRIVVQDCKDAADIIEELQTYADLYEYISSLSLKLARSVLEAWPKWIPVSDRLPEPNTRVIGFMAWKGITVIEYQNGKWYSIDHLQPLPDEAVTHWMSLPKPPKEDEAEEADAEAEEGE